MGIRTCAAILAIATVAVRADEPDSLEVSSATEAAGHTAAIALSLTNSGPVAGLQCDLLFDAEVVRFTGFFAADRGATMTSGANLIGDGRARVVLYHDDAAVLAMGEGQVGTLLFELVGAAGATTAVVPADILVSDAAGAAIATSGEQGTILVTPSLTEPQLLVTVLKNPGRPRIVQFIVTVVGGSGNAPQVTALGAAAPVTALNGVRYAGVVWAPADAGSLTITATDGAGTGSTTVVF